MQLQTLHNKMREMREFKEMILGRKMQILSDSKVQITSSSVIIEEEEEVEEAEVEEVEVAMEATKMIISMEDIEVAEEVMEIIEVPTKVITEVDIVEKLEEA